MTAAIDGMISQIVQTIFSTMLNMELFEAGEPAPSDNESLLASVQIAGEWTGSVILSLPPEVAQAASAAMMQMPAEDVTNEDCCDIAAELANMVGGNLKSVLPGPSYLSLPTIIAGREFGMQVHDADLLDDVVLTSETGVIRVRVFERTEHATHGLK
jgi:chemotaxis protein CheX